MRKRENKKTRIRIKDEKIRKKRRKFDTENGAQRRKRDKEVRKKEKNKKIKE